MTSMVAARNLADLVMGKENHYLEVFSSRKMLRPKLAVNLFESTINLLTPTTKRAPTWAVP